MRWYFKCLSMDHPLVQPVIETFGIEIYGHLCMFMDEYQRQPDSIITDALLCNWLKIRSPKARKILAHFVAFAANFKELLRNNPTGLRRNTQQSGVIQNNTPVTYPPNPGPDGSLLYKRREDQKEIKTDPPLPPHGGDGIGEDFSKIPSGLNPPRLRLVDTRTNTDVSEYQWLQKQLLSHLQSARIRVNLLDQTLEGLMALNPEADKLGRCWLAKPDAERMAAISFARGKPSVTHELRYAMQAINEQWDGFTKLLPAAKRAIDSGDYTVEVSNG